MSVDWRNASDKVAAFRDEVANRIAAIINPMPDMSGRQINRLHGEQRRCVEALAEEITAENARLSRINSELCTSHNALLADGARWEARAKAAEVDNSRLHKAVNSARAALDIIRHGDCFQPKLWAGARLRELDEMLAESPAPDPTTGGEAPGRDEQARRYRFRRQEAAVAAFVNAAPLSMRIAAALDAADAVPDPASPRSSQKEEGV